MLGGHLGKAVFTTLGTLVISKDGGDVGPVFVTREQTALLPRWSPKAASQPALHLHPVAALPSDTCLRCRLVALGPRCLAQVVNSPGCGPGAALLSRGHVASCRFVCRFVMFNLP